jgi:integrase
MPRPRNPVPKAHHHKRSGQVRVLLGGKHIYCGPWDDPASHAKAAKAISDHLSGGNVAAAEKTAATGGGLSIAEVVLAFMEHAGRKYQKHGQPTGEVEWLASTLRVLREAYGAEPADAFTASKLEHVRDLMVAKGWARTSINRRVSRIRRMFKWAAKRRLVAKSVCGDIDADAVEELRRGQTTAPETQDVRPVDLAVVNACLPFMTSVVRSMVKFAAATGARPGEVCILRPCDLDRTDPEVWIFTPSRHKTEHHGQERRVFVGPKAQAAILPFLDRNPEAFVFSPAESEAERRATQRANRKTRVQPSQQSRSRGVKTFADRYDVGAFRQAIQHAVRAANKVRPEPLPLWSPNMLRHAAAMAITREHGVEHARAILGHATIDTTKHYLERDAELARRVAAAIG